ncbi:hypothetical protein BDN72DRAFT_887266 [Pluteus cervinus]|uniref:Uncharacterized protein n=1 Tax=Pluteus cervinus TaxID=181527 RepID=A0ACD3B3Z0_9AGAR|nr:hypothetical protein BDN72DRAFT_887266 [Pluteus cervinus]
MDTLSVKAFARTWLSATTPKGKLLLQVFVFVVLQRSPGLCASTMTHSRFLPKKASHAFTYPTIALFVSLDALERHALDLGRGCIFGYGGLLGRLTSIRPNPYLTSHRNGQTIREKLDALLTERGHSDKLETGGRVFEDAWMLTMPSFCGFEGINPLTVYFCYKSSQLWLVVLEIHNTFGESHVHVLEVSKDEDAKPARGYDHQWTFLREFHVSPFNDRSGFYKVSVKAPSHPPSRPADVTPNEHIPHSPKPAIRVNLHTIAELRTLGRPGPGALKLTALLRPVQSSPLTTASLLSALSKAPFTLFLSMARILYHAWILHYIKRLDVFLRPEPHPRPIFWENSSVEDGLSKQRIGGGVKWLPSGPLETFARARLLSFLQKRVDDTRIIVELVSADPAVPNFKLAPASHTSNSTIPSRTGNGARQKHLIISYLSPRFFTIILLCPSPSHALLLGSKTEKIFNVSSIELFLTLFDFPPSHPSILTTITLSASQRLRVANIPKSIPYSIPINHPLDLDISGSRSISSYLVVWTLLFFERLEAWVFWLSRARLVAGDEPWKQWERAERMLKTHNGGGCPAEEPADLQRKVVFGSVLHDDLEG